MLAELGTSNDGYHRCRFQVGMLGAIDNVCHVDPDDPDAAAHGGDAVYAVWW